MRKGRESSDQEKLVPVRLDIGTERIPKMTLLDTRKLIWESKAIRLLSSGQRFLIPKQTLGNAMVQQ